MGKVVVRDACFWIKNATGLSSFDDCYLVLIPVTKRRFLSVTLRLTTNKIRENFAMQARFLTIGWNWFFINCPQNDNFLFASSHFLKLFLKFEPMILYLKLTFLPFFWHTLRLEDACFFILLLPHIFPYLVHSFAEVVWHDL